jgi:hypothetical protein
VHNKNDESVEIKEKMIFDQDITPTRKLKISDMEGNLFFKKEIVFDVYGLKSGMRKRKDGICYFGIVSENKTVTAVPDKQIDFALNLNLTEIDVKSQHKIFKISYNKSTREYILKIKDSKFPVYAVLSSKPIHLENDYNSFFYFGKVIVSIHPFNGGR